MRYWMRSQADADVLRLQEHLVAPRAAFAAGARGLGAAERLPQIAHVLAVHEAHAGLDGGGDAVRPPEILAPDIAAQSIRDIVRLRYCISLVGERNQAGHRPEDLLLRDAHAVADVREHGG